MNSLLPFRKSIISNFSNMMQKKIDKFLGVIFDPNKKSKYFTALFNNNKNRFFQ